MADQPNAAAPTARPLSPHLSIYRWPVTMASSITHRATGVALAVGTLFLAWWLVAAAAGPSAYANFTATAHSPIGLIVMFGFVWSLSFHLLNGIRHLAWDLGFGFKISTAHATGITVYILSVLLAVAVFACGLSSMGLS